MHKNYIEALIGSIILEGFVGILPLLTNHNRLKFPLSRQITLYELKCHYHVNYRVYSIYIH